MASTERLYTLNAVKVLKSLKSSTFTVEEYASSLLGRVKQRDSKVRAWAYIDPQLILDQARALDQLPLAERGPLHGVAIGIKDVFNTKDMPTQHGSLLYKDNHPGIDSAAVEILRQAGALIFGKTTTSEFTFPNNGPETTNPHDENRTAGGSSAGSAAAVADFQVPLSIGTQTGGSVIRPASYTGIWSMKPSFGAVSLEGAKPCAPSLDTLGFFARDVEGLQLIASIFDLEDDAPPQNVPLGELRVAFIKTPQWPKVGPGTAAAMAKTSKILHGCGAWVEEVEFPDEFKNATALSQMTANVIQREAQASFLKDYRVDKAKLHPENQEVVENVSNVTHKEHFHSVDKIARLQSFISGIVNEYSVFITPSSPDIAPEGIDDFGPATFNSVWTALHMPVINIPAFVGDRGLPVGLSLVTGRFCDQQLLAFGRILGQALVAEGGWNIIPPSGQSSRVAPPDAPYE